MHAGCITNWSGRLAITLEEVEPILVGQQALGMHQLQVISLSYLTLTSASSEQLYWSMQFVKIAQCMSHDNTVVPGVKVTSQLSSMCTYPV